MTRPNRRRTLRLENLENREVLSGPTAEQAYVLSLVNQARTNPSQAAQQFTSNLSADVQSTIAYYNVDLGAVRNAISSAPAQPPVAWSDQIGQAAQGQSQYQADAGVQSHSGANGSNLETRLNNAGYNNIASSGEDIYAYSQSANEAMQAFLIDWGVASNGHRLTIQQPGVSPGDAYKQAGVGIVNTSGKVGPKVVTIDFASQQGGQAHLFGLAYNDTNHNSSYDPGEGQSGVTVQVTNLDNGKTAQAQTQDAGYYDLALAPGDYQVNASRNGQVINSRNVTISNVNVEVDYNLSSLPASTAPSTPPVVTMAAQVATTAVTPSSNPAPVTTPQKTDSVAQNTVTIPQSTPSSAPETAFSKMFGAAFQFSLTSWGAAS